VCAFAALPGDEYPVARQVVTRQRLQSGLSRFDRVCSFVHAPSHFYERPVLGVVAYIKTEHDAPSGGQFAQNGLGIVYVPGDLTVGGGLGRVCISAESTARSSAGMSGTIVADTKRRSHIGTIHHPDCGN
jgi:hypothetical protein